MGFGKLALSVFVSALAIPEAFSKRVQSLTSFTSDTIENLISTLVPLFKDDDLATIFSNCFPNTLDTTIYFFGELQYENATVLGA